MKRSNAARVTTRAAYNVRCSYSAKQLVSELRTWEKMRLDLSMFLQVECRRGAHVQWRDVCFRRPDQLHKMPGCRLVALQQRMLRIIRLVVIAVHFYAVDQRLSLRRRSPLPSTVWLTRANAFGTADQPPPHIQVLRLTAFLFAA